MLQSKQLKDFDLDDKEPSLWNRIYTSKAFDYVSKPYYEAYYIYERLKKNLRFYYNVLRFDYDFDSHGCLIMLNYKFKELYKCLKDGHAIQDPKDLKALRICIKLTQKLWDDNYEMVALDKVEAVYGKLNIDWVDLNDGSGCSRTSISYGEHSSEEDLEKIRAEKLDFYKRYRNQANRDERNLYAIMLKYRRSWWS